MKITTIKKGLFVFAMSMGLTACIHIGTPVTETTQNYTLVDLPSTPIHAPYTGKVVAVGSGEALPRVRSSSMLYQQKDFQLKEYALHRWLAPPVSMIAPIISSELDHTGAFKAVVSAPSYAGMPDYQISVVLERLQQNFVLEKSTEQLVLQLILVNMKTNQVVAAKTFSAEVDAAPDAPGGVLAANQALAQLMPDMIRFIVQTLR